MRIKFVRVDESDRKKIALNLAKLSQKRTGKGSRAGDLLARMGTHPKNPEGASTGPLKEPIEGGRKFKAERLATRTKWFRDRNLHTPGQADPGTAQDRAEALKQGEERGRNRRGTNRAFRSVRQDTSTELFGNKIVEGISKWLAGGVRQAGEHISNLAAKNIERGGQAIKSGLKSGAKWLGKKAAYGAGKLAGKLWSKYAGGKENSSTEIFGNKIVEGFNRLIEEYTGKDDPKKAEDYASPQAQAARKAKDERKLAALKTKEGEKKSTERVGKFVKKVRSVRGQGNPGEPGFISGQRRRSAIQRSIAAENKRRAEAGHEPAKTPPR